MLDLRKTHSCWFDRSQAWGSCLMGLGWGRGGFAPGGETWHLCSQCTAPLFPGLLSLRTRRMGRNGLNESVCYIFKKLVISVMKESGVVEFFLHDVRMLDNLPSFLVSLLNLWKGIFISCYTLAVFSLWWKTPLTVLHVNEYSSSQKITGQNEPVEALFIIEGIMRIVRISVSLPNTSEVSLQEDSYFYLII